jgi:hypothetical protein
LLFSVPWRFFSIKLRCYAVPQSYTYAYCPGIRFAKELSISIKNLEIAFNLPRKKIWKYFFMLAILNRIINLANLFQNQFTLFALVAGSLV